jgi:hypothetical protein
MDETGRDPVFDPGTQAPSPRQLQIEGAVAGRTESFIASVTATMAKPFRWTLNGKPLLA